MEKRYKVETNEGHRFFKTVKSAREYFFECKEREVYTELWLHLYDSQHDVYSSISELLDVYDPR